MVQARTRHLNRQHVRPTHFISSESRSGCFPLLAGVLGGTFDASDDPFRVGSFGSTKLFDRLLHSFDGMRCQQLQHSNELPDAGAGSMPILEPLTQFLKDAWQLPLAIDVRVIQRSGPTSQCGEIVPRLEHLVPGVVTPRMPGNDHVLMHDLHPIHIALHRHRLKRAVPRHAVVHGVEAGELVLVDLRRLPYAGVKAMRRQSRRHTFLFGEPHADRFRPPAARAVPLLLTARTQIRVEFVPILDLRDWRGPLPLQSLHPVLDHRLFIPLRRHAEQRFEDIVAGERRVVPVDLPRPSPQ